MGSWQFDEAVAADWTLGRAQVLATRATRSRQLAADLDLTPPDELQALFEGDGWPGGRLAEARPS